MRLRLRARLGQRPAAMTTAAAGGDVAAAGGRLGRIRRITHVATGDVFLRWHRVLRHGRRSVPMAMVVVHGSREG